MVPPWVPDLPLVEDQDGADSTPPGQAPIEENHLPVAPLPVPFAPPGRFRSCRISLNQFARLGSADAMHRGLAHYVGSGLGGAGTATRRFGGTVHTAGALYGALFATAGGQPAASDSPLDPALLVSSSVNEIMDAVVEAVRPVDGTQDAEANRVAIRESLVELLSRFPEADLLQLSEEERLFIVERYVALDVYARFDLDVGKTIRDNASNATTTLSRLGEVKDYIKETVSAAFRRLRVAGQTLSSASISQTITQALRQTFDVFEGYTS